ncbi:hypothetical protein DFH11DRAFT_1748711 [Phellopilus nigrolimitatus]|nr:hypothetical protein DFH11DRAFT_1748711 [Phellopilus nigrolimitatus]
MPIDIGHEIQSRARGPSCRAHDTPSRAREVTPPSHTVARVRGPAVAHRLTPSRAREEARPPHAREEAWPSHHRAVRVRAARDTPAQSAAAAAAKTRGAAQEGKRTGKERKTEWIAWSTYACEVWVTQGLCIGEWHGPGCKNLEGAKGGGARGDVDGGDATATWVVDVARFGLGPAPKSK